MLEDLKLISDLQKGLRNDLALIDDIEAHGTLPLCMPISLCKKSTFGFKDARACPHCLYGVPVVIQTYILCQQILP